MHARRSTFAVLAACSALVGVTLSARAQENVIDDTFDMPRPPNYYDYGYVYAGGGNMGNRDHSALARSTDGIATGGRGGGNALNLRGDFSQVPVEPEYNYYGIGGGFGTFRYNFETGVNRGLPSGNLADYTFSIDLSGTGFTQADPVPIEVQFLVLDDRFTQDADMNFDPFAVVRLQATGVSTNYATYTFRLDPSMLVYDEARVPAANRDFSAHAVDVGLININTQLQANFGPDNDNVYLIDNVRLTVIPEPASALLLGAAAMLLTTRRSRHSPV